MEDVKEEIMDDEFKEIEERFLGRKFSNKMTVGVLKKAGLSMKSMTELDLEVTSDLTPFIKLLNALLVEGEPFNDDTELVEILLYDVILKSFLDRCSRLMAATERMKSRRSPRL